MISTKMAKTIVVEVTRRVPHPVYKRIVSKRKKFYAHDEAATAQDGRRGADHRVPSVEPVEALGSWVTVLRQSGAGGVSSTRRLTASADTRVKKTLKKKKK